MIVLVVISSVIAVSALATLMRQRHKKPDNVHQSGRQATNAQAIAGFTNHHDMGGGS